jgi:signal transduction histidine kinase
MARLLEEILLYAKPLHQKLIRLDIHQFAINLLDEYQSVALEKNQRFEFHNDEQASIIYGNHDQLMQLFINLARNACEAAPRGETIVWRLLVKSEAKAVEVSITNGGESLSAEQMSHVFEPFFTTKSHGTGLGLGIVKRLVEGHGGDIRMEASSKGTTVTVVFPLADD